MNLKLYAALLLLALSLGGCGMFAAPSPQPLPTLVLDAKAGTPAPSSAPSRGGVTASGVVAPAQQAVLAASLAGSVKSVGVALGDTVQAGQVLVSLAGSERLAAAVQAARFELLSAQLALKALNDQLPDARAAAQLRLANAQKALDEAQKHRTWSDFRNGTQNDIDATQAALVLAQDAVKRAEDLFNPLADKSETDLNRAAALNRLAAARLKRDQILATLNSLLSQPSAVDVAQADAQLVSAQAEVASAQAALEKLKNGPDPDAVALAQGRIQNAQAQLDAAQASLADLDIKAPFAAIVSKLNVHPGDWVVPGQAALALVDVTGLRVETTDLSERDVPQVSVGQKVSITVKSLGQTLTGRVTLIAPLADTLGGDVVYKTTITLDSQPSALRAGMSVTVQFIGN